MNLFTDNKLKVSLSDTGLLHVEQKSGRLCMAETDEVECKLSDIIAMVPYNNDTRLAIATTEVSLN